MTPRHFFSGLLWLAQFWLALSHCFVLPSFYSIFQYLVAASIVYFGLVIQISPQETCSGDGKSETPASCLVQRNTCSRIAWDPLVQDSNVAEGFAYHPDRGYVAGIMGLLQAARSRLQLRKDSTRMAGKSEVILECSPRNLS